MFTFLDLVKVNNKAKPLRPVEITHKLEKYSSAIIPNLFKIVKAKIVITFVIAVGKAFATTFCKNLPLILSLLGSNANINEGIPIVVTLINDNCIGINNILRYSGF